ncbi:eCIS core domain-containing protein [Acaryochloris marina NIES-2412]|uniref:eCIS core domain-containing protein n=1 Tax=Acaryochloris marina TaxID=155978 RepID=UPI004058346E
MGSNQYTTKENVAQSTPQHAPPAVIPQLPQVQQQPIQAKSNEEGLAEHAERLRKFQRLGNSMMKMGPPRPANDKTSSLQPKPWIQRKLTIGEPGDKYEQEADRVASQVAQHINAPTFKENSVRESIQREKDLEGVMCARGFQAAIQRKQAIESGEASADLESVINSVRGGGQPLDAGLQQSMGQTMGADFSGVRVHTDAQSDQLNQSIQARAFTTGQDVFFREGAYQPGSRGGQELIAHELTHVVQQNGGEVQRQNEHDEVKHVRGKLAVGLMSAHLQATSDLGVNQTGMPDRLKLGLEKLSGFDLSGVRVHYSSAKPSQLNALAYTQGQDIEVGPGQEHHLPHEGWHVVQQLQGRVKPTMQFRGVSINDNATLEREASVMGAKALETPSSQVAKGLVNREMAAMPWTEGQTEMSEAFREKMYWNVPSSSIYQTVPIQLLLIPIDRLGPIEEHLVESGDFSRVDMLTLSVSQKIDAFIKLVEPNEKAFLVAYLEGHKHLLLKEANLKETVELVKIYKRVTTPETQTGLATNKSVERMAFRTKLNADQWQKANPEKRMKILVNRANNELLQYGVPLVEADTQRLPPGNQASFDETTWSIHFNAETFNSGNDAYDTMPMAEVTDTVYHESRHAEQFYRSACLLAGDGLDVQQIVKRARVVKWVAAKAVKHPIRREHSDNLHVREAIAWERSLSGKDSSTREKTILAYKAKKLEIAKLMQKAEQVKMEQIKATGRFKELKFKIGRVKELVAEIKRLKASLIQWKQINELSISPEEKAKKLMSQSEPVEFDPSLEAELELDDELNETPIAEVPYSLNDWLQEKVGFEDFLRESIKEFKELQKENKTESFGEMAKLAFAAAQKADEDYKAMYKEIESLEKQRNSWYEKYKNLPEERDAWDVGDRVNVAMQRYPADKPLLTDTVIQCKPVEGVAREDCDLVKMKGKTIYGGSVNRRVNRGDAVKINDEKKYRSRRATVFSEKDREKPRKHRWYMVLEIRHAALEDGLYFPDELFMEDLLSDLSTEEDIELDLSVEMIIEKIGGEPDALSEQLKLKISNAMSNYNSSKIARTIDLIIPEPLHSRFQILKTAMKTAEKNQEKFCSLLKKFAQAAENFQPVLEETSDFVFEESPKIDEEEIDALYKRLLMSINHAKKMATEAKKPLLVMVGDQHYTKSSGLSEYLILDIIQRIKIKNVVLEITPKEAKSIAEQLTSKPKEEMSENKAYLDAWLREIKKGGSQIIPGELNKEEVKEKLGSTNTEEAVEERNKGISLALKKLGSDALLVVGSSHLMGLMKNEEISETYYTLVFNTVDPETMQAKDLLTGTGKIRKSTKFLQENSKLVDTIILKGSVDHLSPKELALLARAAGKK